MTALSARQLAAGYGTVPVVRQFDLELAEGEVLALLGPNGAGKTTLLLTLSGLLPRMGGELDMLGDEAPNGDPVALTRRGLVLVPDDRALFTTLTTRQNIELGQRRGSTTTVDDVLEFFPALRNRLDVRAGSLSGGEQ
jgi:branched-chain amino acid transport system ATP-binding protein